MTVEEAKKLRESLIQNQTGLSSDDSNSYYQDYKGLALQVYEFVGSKEDLLKDNNESLQRALDTSAGALVYCQTDGVIAKRTSIKTTETTIRSLWWEFYGDTTKECKLVWHTLEIP